jgi:hypothetical protein
MEGLSKFVYKNKEILYINHSGFVKDKATQKEKSIQLIKAATDEFIKRPPKSVLTLANVNNLSFDMEVVKVFNEEGAKIRPYEKKTAVVGVIGLVKTVYNFAVGFTNKSYKLFNSEEEAKEWLVSD